MHDLPIPLNRWSRIWRLISNHGVHIVYHIHSWQGRQWETCATTLLPRVRRAWKLPYRGGIDKFCFTCKTGWGAGTRTERRLPLRVNHRHSQAVRQRVQQGRQASGGGAREQLLAQLSHRGPQQCTWEASRGVLRRRAAGGQPGVR